MDKTPEMAATVREIKHEVRVDLTDAAPMKTSTGRRRKPVGLRIQYGVRQDVSRVDIVLEFHNSAELLPPSCALPAELWAIVEANRPADVDSPDPDRRTGMGGWDLPAPTVPEGDVPGFHDPAALHAAVARGLRAIGMSPEDAVRYATAHQQDVLDRAAEAIDDEAWPHEKPEHENQALYRLADRVRKLLATETPVENANDNGRSGICGCGREKQPGENHSMCYPGME